MSHLILYFLSILSLSQAANIIRWTAEAPEFIGFWRLLGAGLILLLFGFYRGQISFAPLKNRKQLVMIAITAMFFFLHLWTYFYAAQNTRIAHCMVLFSTNPIYTALGAWWLFRDPLPRQVLWADFFAFSGILILVWQSLNIEPEHLRGDLAALISALFFSAYLLSSKSVRRELPNLPFTAFMYTMTGLFFGGMMLFKQTSPWPHHPMAWWGVLGTILLPTFMGHAVFSWLMGFLNINWMSTGKLLEPLMAATVALFVFQENISAATLAAFGCTAIAILFLTKSPH